MSGVTVKIAEANKMGEEWQRLRAQDGWCAKVRAVVGRFQVTVQDAPSGAACWPGPTPVPW